MNRDKHRNRPRPIVRGKIPFETKLRREIEALPVEISAQAVTFAHFYDLLIGVLVAIWLSGGIPWGGKMVLRHGADPRRAAIVVGLAGAFYFRQYMMPAYVSSWVIRWVRHGMERLREPLIRSTVLVGCAGWAIALGIGQALALRMPLYDAGIFHQILWGLSHGYGFLSTVSKAGNFLLDHLSPSLALLTPVYWLTGGSPLTLAIIHPLLFYGGVAGWVYFAERAPAASPDLREELAAATVVFGVSFDSLWANLHWGFHENAVAFCALSWAFALLFTYLDRVSGGLEELGGISGPEMSPVRTLGIVTLFLIAAGSKEILLLDVAAVFFVWAVVEFLEAQEYRSGDGSLLAAGLFTLSAVLVLIFLGFEGLHHPADKNYFDRYYAYLGRDIGGMAVGLLASPGAISRNVGFGAIFRYLGSVFLPWLFIPMLWPIFWSTGPDRFWLLAIVPSFLSAALASYPPLRSLDFHYVLELWPLLAVTTLMLLARLGSKNLIWAWAFLALFMMDRDPWGALRENYSEASRLAPVRAHLLETPGDLTVMADDLAGPWISGRPMAARWPDLDLFGSRCPKLFIARVDAQGRSLDFPGVTDLLRRCSKQAPRYSVIWSSEEWRAYLPW